MHADLSVGLQAAPPNLPDAQIAKFTPPLAFDGLFDPKSGSRPNSQGCEGTRESSVTRTEGSLH